MTEEQKKQIVLEYLEDHHRDILEWMVHPYYGQFTAGPHHCLNSIYHGIQLDFKHHE